MAHFEAFYMSIDLTAYWYSRANHIQALYTCVSYISCQNFYVPYTFCLPNSLNFILTQTSAIVNSDTCHNQWITMLLVALHFVSPSYDHSLLTGRKTSSISLSIYIYIMCVLICFLGCWRSSLLSIFCFLFRLSVSFWRSGREACEILNNIFTELQTFIWTPLLFLQLYIYISVCLSLYLSISISIYLSIYLVALIWRSRLTGR